jgi:SH3 domain-containing protein
VTSPVNLREGPSVSTMALTTLQYYTQVQLTGESAPGNDKYGHAVIFYKVLVPSSGQTGWVASNFLDPIVFGSPFTINPNKKVIIPDQYPAGGQAQYLRIEPHFDPLTGKISIDPNTGSGSSYTHNNLCGEFSAAHVAGRPIDVLITDWLNQSDSYWQGRAREALKYYEPGKRDPQLTGTEDIKNMLSQYNCSYKDFQAGLNDEVTGGALVTPNRLKAQIDRGNALILGVNIDSHGTLAQGDIGHWVVVDDVSPQGINNGQVLIYNPMINGQQIYDYDTLLEATKNFTTSNEGSTGANPNDINAFGLWVDLGSCKP